MKPEEGQVIATMIKTFLSAENSNVSDMVRRYNKKYDSDDIIQVFSRQISGGTIALWKFLRILELFGYKIRFEKKDNP